MTDLDDIFADTDRYPRGYPCDRNGQRGTKWIATTPEALARIPQNRPLIKLSASEYWQAKAPISEATKGLVERFKQRQNNRRNQQSN